MLRGGSAGQGAAGSPRPERSPTRSWFKSAMAPFKGSSVFSLRLRCGGAAWSVTYSYKELLAFDAQLRASAAPAARALPELPVARGPSVLRLGALQAWLAAVLDALAAGSRTLAAEPAAAAADDDDDDAELDFSKKKKKKPARARPARAPPRPRPAPPRPPRACRCGGAVQREGQRVVFGCVRTGLTHRRADANPKAQPSLTRQAGPNGFPCWLLPLPSPLPRPCLTPASPPCSRAAVPTQP